MSSLASGAASMESKGCVDPKRVQLDKRNGVELGIQYDLDDTSMRVIAIHDYGLIWCWNRWNPHMTVFPGDRIVEINNVKDNGQLLLEECKRNLILRMKLMPADIDEQAEPHPCPDGAQIEADPNAAFDVKIEKVQASDAELGLDCVSDENDDALVIQQVLPGLIESWNQNHLEHQVQPGDLIVKVNGEVGTAAFLHGALQCEGSLTLTVCPGAGPTYFVVEVSKTDTEQLGWHVEEDGETIVVKKILPDGLLARWNEENPQLQILPGDTVKTVNGVSGSAREIMQKCESDKKLELHVFCGGSV